MKKAVVVLVLGAILFGSCSANYEKKIIGTWTDIENSRWVFSANGELAYENGKDSRDIKNYKYVVDDAKLSIRGYNVDLQTYDISISNGGKSLSLTGGENFRTWSVAGPGWSKNQLTKTSSKSTKSSSKSTNKVDKSLNGTWVGEDDIITFNNGKLEVSSKEGNTLETLTYTASNGKLSLIDPDDDNDIEDFNYSIKGKTLSLEMYGGTRVYTRK